MANRLIKPIVFIVVLLSFFVSLFSYEPLTFEQRVKAQEAIERVYYNHRIWPKENKTPKPPFEKMVPKDVIEKKVEDYLKKSSALETYWYRQITGEQLQAEMDRMAKNTKDPHVLNELFEALNNDPYLIAECLARPVLADRLIRNWYANDERFHSKTKEKAEEALKHLTPENFCNYPEGEYSRISYKLQGEGKEELYPDPEDHSIKLSEKEFYRIYNEIPEEGKISNVIEKDDCFVIVHTVEKNEGLIVYESVIFKKTSLENWLKDQSVKKDNVIAKSEKAYSLSPLNESQCGERWDNGILDDVPEPRAGHTAVWTGTEMIIWGGAYNDGSVHYLNSGAKYNPATDTWAMTSMNNGCPSPRTNHSAVWTGSEMIVWGGLSCSDTCYYLSSGGRYNPQSDYWIPTNESFNCPEGREHHTAVWTGTEMIIWGGRYYNSGWGFFGNGASYNPNNDSWVPISTGINCPSIRVYHTAVWTGTEMIIWGGYSGSDFLNSGGRYNPSNDSWLPTSIGENCPTPRSNHKAIWTGDEMIIWGGMPNSAKYNPYLDVWITASTGSWWSKNASAIWTGNEMIVFGGDNGSPYYGYGIRYNPSNDIYSEIPIDPAYPWGRSLHTAVWTGSEMIIWGGLNINGYYHYYLDNGSRYSPDTNSWIITSCSPFGNLKQAGHTSVWTGVEVIYWGGTCKFDHSGDAYNPSLDSWVPVSEINAPELRSEHTAIWTGEAMIVWGGYKYNNGYIYFNDGGKYNPINNSWSQTSYNNCPLPRAKHSAVWTGESMIIWGGYYRDSETVYTLNSGGIYRPSSDTWLVTAADSNCPVSRYGHTAVWSGLEMIIWGGLGMNTGGRYNPSTNSWISTSTGTYCPEGRSDHTAIWTGEVMIVWGGGYYLNTGARYDPFTDTWQPTSTSGYCPLGRNAHTAVLAGNNMIIWGGYNHTDRMVFLNSGSVYDISEDRWVRTISDQNAPSGRYKHQATWVGNSMIVFGGYSINYLQSGGIYYPGFVKPSISGTSTNPCPSPSVSLSVSGDYLSYQWNLNGIPIDGATSSTYEATVSGSYTVSVTDSEGCSGTSDPHPVTIVACIPEIIYDSNGSFTEVTGNGNSYFEKGEKWKVSVTVRNSGNTPATNVTANLTGNGIQVCNNPGVFGTISAGGTASYEFEFLIDSNFSPCGGYIDFGLINKQCVEKTPAGSDEFNLFSIQVGQISSGVPTELVIQPSSIDSWINQASQNGNYGSDTSIYVQSRNLQARRLLVQFDLSSIPLNSTINSATLELYATQVTGSNTIELHRITSGWSEGSVTWTSQPTFDSTANSTLSGINSTGWKVWDVKSLIEGYLNGTYTNYGFILKHPTETGAQLISTTFASKENSNTTQRPILRVNYTPPTSLNCDYIGSGECLIPLPQEVAPGDSYENGQMWSEDKNTQSWTPVSQVTTYKVYRGIKSSLPNLLTGGTNSCLRYQGTNTSIDLSSDDPSSDIDKMYWYLIIGSNSSGDGPAGNGRIVNSSGSCQ